uniref:Uncharacterized protein n=1 Tax=Panagrolaimus sp. ES5 TaxID=591445 RepID=A0AC34GHF3_9BILA
MSIFAKHVLLLRKEVAVDRSFLGLGGGVFGVAFEGAAVEGRFDESVNGGDRILIEIRTGFTQTFTGQTAGFSICTLLLGVV